MASKNQFSYLYKSDEGAWRNYFMDMAEGGANNTSRFTVLKSSHKHSGKHDTPQPLKLVTESAQVVDIAKSELRQEEQELNTKTQLPARSYKRAPPSKRRKAKILKETSQDIFN